MHDSDHYDVDRIFVDMINVAIELSNSYLPVLVHYGVLVHEGSVVTVEGGIMHKPKASIICLSALTKLHNAQ